MLQVLFFNFFFEISVCCNEGSKCTLHFQDQMNFTTESFIKMFNHYDEVCDIKLQSKACVKAIIH